MKKYENASINYECLLVKSKYFTAFFATFIIVVGLLSLLGSWRWLRSFFSIPCLISIQTIRSTILRSPFALIIFSKIVLQLLDLLFLGPIVFILISAHNHHFLLIHMRTIIRISISLLVYFNRSLYTLMWTLRWVPDHIGHLSCSPISCLLISGT